MKVWLEGVREKLRDRFGTRRVQVGEAAISWPKVPGAVAYNVYRHENSYKVLADGKVVDEIKVRRTRVTQAKPWWRRQWKTVEREEF